MPGAFKLDHLQLYKLYLVSIAPHFFVSILAIKFPRLSILCKRKSSIFQKAFDRRQYVVKSPEKNKQRNFGTYGFKLDHL